MNEILEAEGQTSYGKQKKKWQKRTAKGKGKVVDPSWKAILNTSVHQVKVAL